MAALLALLAVVTLALKTALAWRYADQIAATRTGYEEISSHAYRNR